MSRHQSFGVVAELAEFTKVNRVSRSLELGSFVFLREILRNSSKVRHSSRPKYTRHSRKCLRKSECNRQLLQIWHNERNYRPSVRKLFRPRTWKITIGREDLPVYLKNSNHGSTFCSVSKADFRPDGRDEWYIRHHLSFRSTHFTLPPAIIYPSPLRKNIYAKSAPTTSGRETSRNVAPTDDATNVCRV